MPRTRRTRRAAGEGTILRLADGRYQARITYWFAGKRKYRSVTAHTIPDVLTRKAELEQEMAHGIVTAKRGSLNEFFDSWLAHMRSRVRASTLAIYTRCLTRLRPYIGSLEIRKLNAQDVAAALAGLGAERVNKRPRYKAETIKRTLEVLRNALKVAVKWKLARENVALDVEPPMTEEFEAYALSEIEIRRLLNATAGHRLHALYQLALRLGMRESELLGLHWSEVDLERGRVKISRALEVATLDLVEPKSKAGKRTVPLSPALITILRHHRTRQLHEQAAFRRWSDHGLVFCTRVGTPMRAANLIRTFKEQLRAARLPSHIRIHDLRHTCITHMLEKGVPPHVVSAWVGHASTKVTMDVYAHVTERGLLDAAEIMDAIAGDEKAS